MIQHNLLVFEIGKHTEIIVQPSSYVPLANSIYLNQAYIQPKHTSYKKQLS